MRCPKCRSYDSYVLETRCKSDTIRRRRECNIQGCEARWTTQEIDQDEYKKLKSIYAGVKRLGDFL